MMNNLQMYEALKNLTGWELVDGFSVGGFEYMGFSKMNSHKLIIISSQMETVYDCEDKSLTEMVADIDEKEFVAISDLFPDEIIPIATYWGGSMPHETAQGERVEISYYGEHVISGKELKYQQIQFIDKSGDRNLIYDNYPCYVCGFSYDGNYFALADDGGVMIIRRKDRIEIK